MSKKATIQADPFIQIPKNITPMYEFNENTRTLELMEYRDDVKYIDSNKNLTFKEMLEKYGTGFVNNKNNGFAVDDTLIYKDINNMWNDGQAYQQRLKENKEKAKEAAPIIEELEKVTNIENNTQEVNNDTTKQ